MPKDSDDFSDYQMNRLLKRHAVQISLEQAGKEMGGRALSLQELEELLGEQGVLKDDEGVLPSKRIAQDSVTRYMLVQRTAGEKKLPGLTEEKVEKKEEKGFDITEHLQDVDWSSESDGEFGGINNVPEVNNVLVGVKKDVAEILAVLEDDEVKIEPSESKIVAENFSEIVIEERPEIETEERSKMAAEERPKMAAEEQPKMAAEEEPKMAAEEYQKIVAIESPKIVAEELPKIVAIESPKTVPEELPKIVAIEPPKVVAIESPKVVAEELPKIVAIEPPKVVAIESPKIIESAQNEKIPSSSDSESECELVPIEDPDPINLITEIEKPLQVVIIPEKIDKDDLFADIFVEAPKKVDDEKLEEKVATPPPRPINANEEIERLDQEIAALSKDLEDEEMEEEEEEEEKEKEKVEEREKVEEIKKPMTEEELLDLKKSLEEEQGDLMAEQGKQERHAQSVTDQMCQDAQVCDFWGIFLGKPQFLEVFLCQFRLSEVFPCKFWAVEFLVFRFFLSQAQNFLKFFF